MKHRFRYSDGFTIVELATVIAIIAILATISVVAWNTVRANSRDEHHKSTAILIAEAAEKYYEKNGEYPSRESLNPTNQTVALPNYDSVTTVMPELKNVDLSPSGYTFMPLNCSGLCPNNDAFNNAMKKQIVYLTKASTVKYYSYGLSSSNGLWGCVLAFDTTTPGTTAGFVLIWRDEINGKWNFKRSRHGDATITGSNPAAPTTCTFS